ncbi:MAG: substrate-binding domain-containing protein [Deltaproteobacteria bacterium]|nr:substrate-binding domain-containing protein [Deltaproteobacteria bacterium]
MNDVDYRLIANLGRGGMADVFLAARLGPASFTKLVVMKRLRSDLVEPQFRTLMLDEARLAARLHHANIVQTNEVSDRDGLPYLIMEYLEGCSVAQVMRAAARAGVRIELPYVLRIVKDVLAALIYAHGLTDYDGRPLHVVHRDVSPQNIFWTYDGQIKLMDFGIAKYALSSLQTEIGMIKGKLPYMPPEQARGERVDERADLYGLGVVMWELVAGRRLFRAPNAAAELHNVLYMRVPVLDEIWPDVDPRLAAICARALERDREARFETAAAMQVALDEIDAPTATHAELGELVRRLCGDRRASIAQQIHAALAGEGLADPEGGELTTYAKGTSTRAAEASAQARDAHESRPAISAPETQVPRRRFWGMGMLGLMLVAGAAGAAGAWLRSDGNNAAVAPRPAAMPLTPTSAEPPPPALRLCGSDTIGSELAPALAEAFLARKGATKIARLATEDAEHTIVVGVLAGREISIDVIAHGSATAFDGLAAKTCDVGMASRAINDGEVAKLASLGNLRSPATEHVIALDGIAVIVNPNNPLRALDRATLHDIFTGKTAAWSGVPGGGAGTIHVLARDNKSGTYDTFKNLVLGGDKLVSGATRYASSEQLADAVATDPDAIGFIGLAYVRSAKAVAVGDSGVQAMIPTPFTVTTEDYLLARRLYFYTPASPSTPLVAELVSFAMSAQGQEVVRDAGFVDLTVGVHPGSRCDVRCPASYADATHHARRLSLDFRFREGSDEIDSRATRDLDRLTQTLRGYPDSTLVLFGFSDSSGDPTVNLALSKQRAKAIADELATRGITSVVIDGFGPALPVASNATAAGRQRNRRVEVWLR